MELFRLLEPERPVVCLFEDLDAIIDEHGDTELSSGSTATSRSITSSIWQPRTTPRNSTGGSSAARGPRPHLQDRGNLGGMREAYLARKRPDLTPKELRFW